MEHLEYLAHQVHLVPLDNLDVQVIQDKVLQVLLVRQVSQGTGDQDLKETKGMQDLHPAQVQPSTRDPLEFLGYRDKRDLQVPLDPEANQVNQEDQETLYHIVECRLCKDHQDRRGPADIQDHRELKGTLGFLALQEAQCQLPQALLVLLDLQDLLASRAPFLLPVRCASTSLTT